MCVESNLELCLTPMIKLCAPSTKDVSKLASQWCHLTQVPCTGEQPTPWCHRLNKKGEMKNIRKEKRAEAKNVVLVFMYSVHFFFSFSYLFFFFFVRLCECVTLSVNISLFIICKHKIPLFCGLTKKQLR